MLIKNNKGGEQLLLFQDMPKEEELQKAYHEGYEKAKEELKEHYLLLERVSAKLLEEKKELLAQMKPEVIDFCLHLTEQILRQELSDPKVLANLISSLLMATSRKNESLSVLLAEEDLALLEPMLPKLQGQRGQIYFYADPTLQRGDVRIQGDSMLVNCTLHRSMESVRTHVLRGTV